MSFEPPVRLTARITGRVQGVFYRATTRREASARGLTGWVRNCADGSVQLVAEGPRDACEELLSYCRKGPPSARVDAVDASWSRATGAFSAFETRF